jgi:hypothetical protein
MRHGCEAEKAGPTDAPTVIFSLAGQRTPELRPTEFSAAVSRADAWDFRRGRLLLF